MIISIFGSYKITGVLCFVHCLFCGFINILFISFCSAAAWTDKYIYIIHSQLCSQHLIIQTTNESSGGLVESKEKAASIFLAWVKHIFFSSLWIHRYIANCMVGIEACSYISKHGRKWFLFHILLPKCAFLVENIHKHCNIDWNGFDWRRKTGTRCMYINRRNSDEWVTIISFRAANEERKRITSKTRTR